MNLKLTPLLVVIIVTSILGFCTENIWVAFRYGYMDNRGMIFPALLGYGLAMAAMFLVFGTPDIPCFFGMRCVFPSKSMGRFYYFLASFLAVCVGETALGNIVEKTCGIEWWNYEAMPLNLGKYTSVPTSAGFSVMITIFMGNIFPKVYAWSAANDSLLLDSCTITVILLLIADFVHAACYMARYHCLYMPRRHQFSRKPQCLSQRAA